MKERPILMNAFSVKAILAGHKTQTWRVIKPQPEWGEDGIFRYLGKHPFAGIKETFASWALVDCPYGQPGDRLWVRETRWINGSYVATEPAPFPNAGKTPSIFMPRWASRILLEVTGVRVERVQSIATDDCEAEGITGTTLASPIRGQPYEEYRTDDGLVYGTPQSAFAALWDSINAKRGYGWELNPWVWVVSFVRVEEAE